MNNYGFTVRVMGIDINRDDFPDALYEAGCDDALVLVAHGKADPPRMKPVVGWAAVGGEIGRFYGASEPAY